jgi:putative peptidoglycan lipid II flippase
MSERRSIARAARSVSFATALSRLLGVAREMTISHRFPTSGTDAFIAAFRIPNLLRDLLAEGALSSAFVPVFAETEAEDGKKRAFALASAVLATLAVVGGVLALAMIVSARPYALIVASGFDETRLALTGTLGRIMAPFLVTVCLSATLMGMANVRGRFFLPALAPAVFNVGVLTGGWLVAPLLEARGWPGVTGLALGATLGGLLQLALQIASVRGWGFSFRLEPGFWRDARLRRVLARIGPAAFGVAATYVNILIDTQVASYFGRGPVSYLFFAMRLWMLPVGLFSVAIATAHLAGVSRDAAAGDDRALRRTLASSIRLTLLLTVPAAVALACWGGPIVRVVYQHGLFDAADARATALLVALYAVGLPGYSLVKVLVPTFYALGDVWTPVRLAALVIAVKIAASALLVPRFGYPALAFATGAAAVVHALVAARALRGRTGRLRGESLARTCVVSLASCAAMVAGTSAVAAGLRVWWPGDAWMPSAARLAGIVIVGVVLVGLVLRVSGVPEARLVGGRREAEEAR